jgi:hypothetical protein
MADYIYPGPGSAESQLVLKIRNVATGTRHVEENMTVPSLQDITVNAANDVFTWTQLDASAKKQIATTATNSLAMNLVVSQETFFGLGFTTVANEAALPSSSMTVGTVYYATTEKSWHVATSASALQAVPAKPTTASGILGLSTDKTRVEFELYFGDTSSNTEGKFISSFGYITGLAPTVSADSPVWVSPITLTIDEDYTIADTAPFPTT